MSNTYTVYYNLAKPAKFDLDWEDELNGNFDQIDSLIKAVNNALDNHESDTSNPHQVTFLQLMDTISSYSGLANRVVIVNNNANGLTTTTKVPAAVVADYTLSVNAGSTFPENPVPGETFFNTSDKKMYFWDTTQWIEIHPKNKDTYLDYGGTNQISASQAKTAYTQTHTHSNKALLDTYTQTEANIADAVSKKHTQNTDTGTTSQTFQLQSGSSGVKLKNNAGVFEVRNSGDSSYAIIRGNTPSGSNDLCTKSYVDSAVSTAQSNAESTAQTYTQSNAVLKENSNTIYINVPTGKTIDFKVNSVTSAYINNYGIVGSVYNSDFAEGFVSNEIKMPENGTVMIFDPHSGQVQVCNKRNSKRFAGVISYKPGHLLGMTDNFEEEFRTNRKLPLALVGQVYVWVTSGQFTPIKPGDALMTDDNGGLTKCSWFGHKVATAMEFVPVNSMQLIRVLLK